MSLEIVRTPRTREMLVRAVASRLGLVKAVVDVRRGIMAIGGELHSDEEAALLEDGSAQTDVWGINLYPSESGEGWIEFDSMINLRPSQGNRSRGVEDAALRQAIQKVVEQLVREGP